MNEITKSSIEGAKKYLGTKELYAIPMSRANYNKLRGWELPSNEQGSDKGYLVEYVKGGSTNLKGFEGYVSWSPKDVFEESYKEIEITDYIGKLKEERDRARADLKGINNTLVSDEFYSNFCQKEKECIVDHQSLLYKLIDNLNKRIKLHSN